MSGYFQQMYQNPYMQTVQQATPRHQVLRLKNESAVWAQAQQLQPDSSDIYLRDDGALFCIFNLFPSSNI